MSRRSVIYDSELGELTDDRLTSEVRVYQRLKGHRFSVDDVATAYVAASQRPDACSVLDLGCGLGSVLLHLAWSLPRARLTGVEAQSVSVELLKRNVARNGYENRITTYFGDLRAESTVARIGTGFDLITGTPPYFPADAALDAQDEQRAYARVEYRGGIEDYVATAARVMAHNAIVVLCGDARSEARLQKSANSAGLFVHSRCDIIPRAGKPPLFSIWSLSSERARAAVPQEMNSLLIRDALGNRTPDAERLRAFSGFPPSGT